jgi:hypothetical protein
VSYDPRFVAVDDCGNIINPMIVDGQIHGGLTMGVAPALMEEMSYDEEGNNQGRERHGLSRAHRNGDAEVRGGQCRKRDPLRFRVCPALQQSRPHCLAACRHRRAGFNC